MPNYGQSDLPKHVAG